MREVTAPEVPGSDKGMLVVNWMEPDCSTGKMEKSSRVETAEAAQWQNFAEMKADFGSVDAVGNQHYVFNIRGNKYRLVVVVKFVMGYVFIRFVGTHEEYENIDAATI